MVCGRACSARSSTACSPACCHCWCASALHDGRSNRPDSDPAIDSLSSEPRTFSFEFFPPKSDEAAQKLRATRARLAVVAPDFFSVTYGAGGSTREGTVNTVLEMHRAGLPVAPHLSCIGSNRTSIRQLLQTYQEVGIRRLVALRGDLP